MATKTKAKIKGHGFGTAPVFLAAISTILGAILFLLDSGSDSITGQTLVVDGGRAFL